MESSSNPYQAPSNGPSPSGSPTPLSTKQVLFGFTGRISRRTFWTGSLAIGLGFIVFAGILSAATGGSIDPETGNPTGMSSVAALIIGLLYIPMTWISLALQIKRWHDRGKPGWWCLINFIPIIGGLWSFIEVGCLRGTVGPNEYGEDPI
ncbi:uncharacterized membrane protein YhaH (DUF805 family) [Haloferula luteola]|uniref:Uncharacterized membrane protein YhaH (DUF805 family) n=1 Tax=Haloferula luteola TaxID=595692 RepID=A0A840V212_9BACT|nr:DUF805 domain-containing protein [Haloferula luteola]MBB5352032.1 uncharacterized membrane protein YhaH (DUF805 family) [Haloferula luteola]